MNKKQLLQQIDECRKIVFVAASGDYHSAISDLASKRGGSWTVWESTEIQSEPALKLFVGTRQNLVCGIETARAMAMLAFQRAREFTGSRSENAAADSGPERDLWMGIGYIVSDIDNVCTSDVLDVHVAVQTDAVTRSASLRLGVRETATDIQKDVLEKVLLNEVARACAFKNYIPLDLGESDRFTTVETVGSQWRDLVVGTQTAICVRAADNQRDGKQRLLFPGSFCPRHEGHVRMGKVAEKLTGCPTEIEFSVINVDKPPMNYTDIATRLAQFKSDESVWLTRAPTFVEKSRLFPHATFIVGADTVVRIADPRYYGNDSQHCKNAIQAIASQGCRFLVFGRLVESRFCTLPNLSLPQELLAICSDVSEEEFRIDVSSTSLRQQS